MSEEVKAPESAPLRPVPLPDVDLDVERRDNGEILIRHNTPIEIAADSVPAGLARQASLQPDKPHLAERAGSERAWRMRSFCQVKRDSDAVAQWLLDKNIPAERPVMILSGNSIAHATMRYGAFAAHVPVSPVSINYSRIPGSYDRLQYVFDLVKPAVVFAEDGAAQNGALNAMDLSGVTVVSRNPDALDCDAVAYDEVLSTPVTDAVEKSIASIDPDATTAYMLTSGSTGRPKAVMQTQRMLITNLSQGWQTLGKASGWDDVLLEWLPWSHVSGAFTSMAAAIFGGTLYIDDGKPLPGLFDESVRNLREIPLKYFTNVPTGYAMLVDALEADDELRETFFSKLGMMLYGGAGLPQPVLDRLQTLAVKTTGHRIFMTTGYGATETASGCMAIYWPTDKVGVGLPMPGLTIKLVPADDRYEIRFKGPMVMSGYYAQPEKNKEIFDEEGFYKIGDTVTFIDENDPKQGLAFAGRLAEEFKLATGTWVAGGNLRAQLVKALAPAVSDAVICGENRDYVAILAWPDAKGLQKIAGKPDADAASLLDDPAVSAHIAAGLKSHNDENPGKSAQVKRLMFLTRPPDPEAHELSDKGTVNQAIAKNLRADDIDRLYADPMAANIITPDE